MINAGVVTVSYIIATILFIMALGGLSNQETARRGNMYGMLGMAIAVIATLFGPEVTDNYFAIILAMVVGGGIGIHLARKVEMTQMPELVAILHSFVGLAAVLVGFASYFDPNNTINVKISMLKFCLYHKMEYKYSIKIDCLEM